MNTDLPCNVIAARIQFNNGTATIAATPALRFGKSFEDSIFYLSTTSPMSPLLATNAGPSAAFRTDTAAADNIVWEDERGASRIVAICFVGSGMLDSLEIEALSQCGAENSLD